MKKLAHHDYSNASSEAMMRINKKRLAISVIRMKYCRGCRFFSCDACDQYHKMLAMNNTISAILGEK